MIRKILRFVWIFRLIIISDGFFNYNIPNKIYKLKALTNNYNNEYLNSLNKRNSNSTDKISSNIVADQNIYIKKKSSNFNNYRSLKERVKHSKYMNNLKRKTDYMDKLTKLNSTNYLDTLEKKTSSNILEKIIKSDSRSSINNYNYTTKLIIPIFQNGDPIDLLPILGSFGQNTNDNVRRVKHKKKTSDNGNFILEDITNFNFTTIGGYNDIKDELIQIIEFLIDNKKYAKYNVRNTRGILLHGPPGNGKTLFARCLAGETNISFIACAGSEFSDKYVGVGSSKIRELFDFARNNKPTIIFIDEFDAMAKTRVKSGEAADSERDQTLNQLLVALDGFKSNEEILVIAATNRMDILDPAIIRPGRIDKIIQIPNPDADTRKEILNIHLDRKPIESSIDELVIITGGLSGAQIEGLLNEVSLYGIRKNELPVTSKTVEEFKDRILFGYTNKKQSYSPDVLYRIAIHEIGHVLMALKSKYFENPIKVTIDPTNSNSLGFTMFEHNDLDNGIYTREYLEDRIKVYLAGRAAEELMFGKSISSGAVDDLNKALLLAKDMITDYGMGMNLIYTGFGDDNRKLIDNEINILINEMYMHVIEYLRNNMNLLLILSDNLIINKTLTYDNIIQLIN